MVAEGGIGVGRRVGVEARVEDLMHSNVLFYSPAPQSNSTCTTYFLPVHIPAGFSSFAHEIAYFCLLLAWLLVSAMIFVGCP